MRLLANPALLQAALISAFCTGVLVLGAVLIRRLRSQMTGKQPLQATPRADSPSFELAAYHGVIAELKQQQEQSRRLRDSESQRAATTENISTAVLSNLSTGVVLFARNGLVAQINPAARRILGYASATGLRARELFRTARDLRSDTGPATAVSLAAAVEETLASSKEFRRLEVDYVTPSGEERVLGITVSPVRGAGAATPIMAAACLISDLTEITALARNARLKENLAALGEMSAGIAHEFKNSLATISGYGQMLASEPDPQLVRDFAAKINSETAALSRIVTEFLNFARPQALNLQPVRLADLVREAARGSGVELNCSRVSADCVIMGDKTALRQSFANLFRNSAEAARNGTPVRVEVSAQGVGNQVCVRVQDNGVGIPQDALSKVFIPFFTTKPHGTGLGLALVHRLLAEHGGSVTVASGKAGTTFTLSFPTPEAESTGARGTGRRTNSAG